ncbi:MAG: class A beta-lactamase-related serine hydrolase [Geminocystis sp.]|nr:class A beta-lactamase-related serine hydrolase [Geminocystis sp.]MCS7147474.1 class A beta-lactamase-related serine hydrolase [Geminocystis sp.]MDW8115167.1 serine hydrolase [Geminocystis sp.]MDW8464435.1 serine hydrolase [Geminocystis sp.]
MTIVVNNVFRLTIVGVGMGTIFGTLLANLDLTKPVFPKIDLPFVERIPLGAAEKKPQEKPVATNPNPPTGQSQSPNPPKPMAYIPETRKPDLLKFTRELTALRAKFKTVADKYSKLQLSAFFVDLDTGSYINYNGNTRWPAASTIKVPILVAFFQDVDAGLIRLDEKLTMTEKNKAGGSGNMQYQKVGTQYTALYTATEMIISSDNTATNMLIERLGGIERLNKRFREWGLEHTIIRNLLPDLEGTNTTSARDLAILLGKVNQGDLISLRSRDRLLEIMRQTKTRTLLPQGIEPSATIAHKTGDIGVMLGDAGIVDMPTGKRYIAAVLVKRPHNDPAGRSFIQEISRTAYQHFKWYQKAPVSFPATDNRLATDDKNKDDIPFNPGNHNNRITD